MGDDGGTRANQIGLFAEEAAEAGRIASDDRFYSRFEHPNRRGRIGDCAGPLGQARPVPKRIPMREGQARIVQLEFGKIEDGANFVQEVSLTGLR